VTNSFIEPFVSAIENLPRLLANPDESGKRYMGYLCTYTPIELIHAAGFVPVRLFAGPGEVEQAYAHVPDFICPFLKRVIQRAAGGGYAALSGLIQGYTCDAACGVVNTIKEIMPEKPVFSIPIPYGKSGRARLFLKSAMDEAICKLESVGGDFSQNSIARSIQLYESIRKLQYFLYEPRDDGALPLSAKDRISVMTAGTCMPPEAYLEQLARLEVDLAHDPGIAPRGVPVLVSGSLVESTEIFDAIEASGGFVVCDDLCNGFRQIPPFAGQGKTPMDRLADRYISRMPCPSRSRAVDRCDDIAGLAQKHGAAAIIFVLQKFCTPHLSDFPILSEELNKKGYPVLLIEMDESWAVSGQTRTRLESFFEMTGGA